MELTEYVENIRRQFAAAALAGGEEAKAQAARLFAPLESAIRLTLQEALAAAAEEITCELAPGSVELRLRLSGPEFVVNLPRTEPPFSEGEAVVSGLAAPDGEGDATSRINLRLPEHLKAQVEEAATSEGLSINSWLVRATAAALERAGSARRQDRRPPTGSERYTGWSR